MTGKSERAIRQVLAYGELELRPNFTRLSKQTGLPVSTLFDGWQRVKASGQVSVFAIIGEEKKVVEYKTMQQKFDPTKKLLSKAHFAGDGVGG